MRLTPQHIETIKGAAAQPDLLQTIRCKVLLQDALDMPVDLVVKPIGDQSPISKIAKAEGVRL